MRIEAYRDKRSNHTKRSERKLKVFDDAFDCAVKDPADRPSSSCLCTHPCTPSVKGPNEIPSVLPTTGMMYWSKPFLGATAGKSQTTSEHFFIHSFIFFFFFWKALGLMSSRR